MNSRLLSAQLGDYGLTRGVAYLSSWSLTTCSHFVRYEGACTAIALAVSELLLLIRIIGLYWDKRIIPAAVFVIWIAQQAISVWLLSHGEAVRHEESFDHACTMFFHLTAFPPSLSAWIPLLFDTVVIGLVLYKCLPKIPEKRITMTRVYETLVKDGLMYYAVLFSVNFVLGVMIIVAQVRLRPFVRCVIPDDKLVFPHRTQSRISPPNSSNFSQSR